MPKAAPPKSPTEGARFSAPCCIGPVLEGVAPGSVIEVEGATPNAGRYVVAAVDADWITVAERVIVDHANADGVTVTVVKEPAA